MTLGWLSDVTIVELTL